MQVVPEISALERLLPPCGPTAHPLPALRMLFPDGRQLAGSCLMGSTMVDGWSTSLAQAGPPASRSLTASAGGASPWFSLLPGEVVLVCNELPGRERGSPLRGEVLKMGFSQGRKRLQLAKNTHRPQLPAPLWLYLPRWGPEGMQGLRSWRGCKQTPEDTERVAAERCSGLGRG